MPIVGLTGGIGAGKSLAAQQFAALGVSVIDTDLIAHTLTAVGMPLAHQIADLFGKHYLHPDGSLNRIKLRQKIFSQASAKAALEALLHPAIRAEVLQKIKQNSKKNTCKYQLVVVPLLFETGHYASILHQTVVVDCSPELQIARVLARAGNTMTKAEVQLVIDAQISREARLAKADSVITNDGSAKDLLQQVHAIHQVLTKNCYRMH